jgi:hypothetical protein
VPQPLEADRELAPDATAADDDDMHRILPLTNDA